MFRGFVRWPIRHVIIAVGALILPLSTVQAGIVDYTLTPLGGHAWRYDYTLNNLTPSLGFDEVTIFFDVNTVGSLFDPVAPAGWDLLVIQPDPALPADGYLDALIVSGPLAEGASASGFSVSFTHLGTGTPSVQFFDLLDSSTFSVIHSGRTTPEDGRQIPEPASVALVLVALGAGLYRRPHTKSDL